MELSDNFRTQRTMKCAQLPPGENPSPLSPSLTPLQLSQSHSFNNAVVCHCRSWLHSLVNCDNFFFRIWLSQKHVCCTIGMWVKMKITYRTILFFYFRCITQGCFSSGLDWPMSTGCTHISNCSTCNNTTWLKECYRSACSQWPECSERKDKSCAVYLWRSTAFTSWWLDSRYSVCSSRGFLCSSAQKVSFIKKIL